MKNPATLREQLVLYCLWVEIVCVVFAKDPISGILSRSHNNKRRARCCCCCPSFAHHHDIVLGHDRPSFTRESSTTTTKLYARKDFTSRSSPYGGNWNKQKPKNELDDEEAMEVVENHVMFKAQERMDLKRIVNALDSDQTSPPKFVRKRRGSSSSSSMSSRGGSPADLIGPDEDDDDVLLSSNLILQPWKIALAASIATSSLSYFLLFHSLFVSAVILIVVFVAASGDPLDDGDGLTGPIARIIGRYTIRSVQATQPKVRAVARAALTGQEEISALKKRVFELEHENKKLKLWRMRRIQVDSTISNYSLDYLKEQARRHNVPVTGVTKGQILMRLIEAGVIETYYY